MQKMMAEKKVLSLLQRVEENRVIYLKKLNYIKSVIEIEVPLL